jgi:Secretion system C-terminal sorting domain
MYKSITKVLCLTGLLFFGGFANSQTTTINYLNSGLSTSACNVFTTSATVNNVVHTPLAGGVTFNTTNGIGLSTTPQASTPGGTAFVIAYSFTPGNNYTISITALGNPALRLKTSVVPNLSQFSTNGTALCTPDQNVNSYVPVGVGQLSAPTTTTSTAYNIPQFSVPGTTAYPNLIIWASGGRSNFALDELSISQVVITQIAGTPGFTIPSSTTVTCGSTTAQTFTVTNASGTTGITDYTWNLGTTPNNWLYNNIAAPATVSTGIINSITLTPVCGSTPKNISATITANATAYNTNTSTVSISQPAMSITGGSTFCTSGAYLITGLPCNASVVWSASPTGIVTPNTFTGTNPTFTKVANGNITLSATVTSCGVVQPALTQTIRVGGYTTSDYPITGPSSTTCGTLVTYSVPQLPNSPTYVWQYQGGQGTRFLQMRAPNQTSAGIVYMHVDNACGTGPITSKLTTVRCSFALIDLFQVSPNPATNEVTVTANSISTTSFTELKIYNQQGVLKKTQKFAKVKKVTINVSSLPTGIYFIEIVDGTNRERQQLIILK